MKEMKPEPKEHKNPILAAIGIPLFGIGYIYLGRYVRFVIFLVVSFGFYPAVTLLRIRNIPPIVNLLIIVCFMLDAYTIALKQNGGDETVMF